MFLVTPDKKNLNRKTKKYLFISTIESNKVEQKLEKENSQQCPIFTAPNNFKEQNFGNQKATGNSLKKKIFFNLYKTNILNNNSDKNEQKQLKIKYKIQNKKIVNTNFKPKKAIIINENNSNKNHSTGRWNRDEHQRFIDGIIKYGNNWRQVQKYIGTRSSTQIRSHAQKFFDKLKRSKIFKKGEYDLSTNSLKLLYEIMSKLSEKQKVQATKKLYSLPYEINYRPDNINKNKSEDEFNFSNDDEDFQNNNNKNDEENIKTKLINNKDDYYLEKDENNNNKLNNNDYIIYDENNYNYEYYNFGIRSRKGSDIFNNQRKNSLSELKEIKNEINNFEDYNEDINSNIAINEDEDETIKNKLNFLEYSFSNNSSRKISFEEKIIASVH